MNFFEEFGKPNFANWKEEAEKSLKGKKFESLFSNTLEDITIKPLYTKEDLPAAAIYEYPGLPYFSRGWKVDGFRLQPWKIIQRIEMPSPNEANKVILNEIEKGTDGFLIKHFDPLEANSTGVIVESIFDFEDLFKNVDLTKTYIHFETPYPVEFFSFFLAYLYKNNIPLQNIIGSITFDIYNKYLRNGKILAKEYILNNLLMKLYEKSSQVPEFDSIVIDGTIFYESGSNIVQELAFTLSKALEFLKALASNGINAKEAINKFMFKVSIGSDIFLNLAKLRALRILWSKILESINIPANEVYVPIYSVTTKRNKSRMDTYVNMLRNTCETFTAILGTSDYIEVTPYDYFSNSTEEFSYRNARNTQLVLKDEHHITEVIDPAGGSWFLEALTYEISSRALEILKDIEANGGFFANIINGTIQNHISSVRTKKLTKLAKREDVLVGTNKYPNPSETISFKEEAFGIYKKVLEERQEFVKKHQNIQPEIGSKDKELSQYALSFGLLSSVLPINDIKENIMEIVPFEQFRESEDFEKLRTNSELFKENYGVNPKVLTIAYGKISEFKERLDFANEFFQIGGFEVITLEEHKTIEEIFAKFYEIQPQVVVFCSTNDKYIEFVPQVSSLIKKAKPLTVVAVAGLPSENELNILKQSGVDIFIHLRSDLVETLNSIFRMFLGNEYKI